MGLAPSLSYGMAVLTARPRSAAQSLLFFHFSGPWSPGTRRSSNSSSTNLVTISSGRRNLLLTGIPPPLRQYPPSDCPVSQLVHASRHVAGGASGNPLGLV